MSTKEEVAGPGRALVGAIRTTTLLALVIALFQAMSAGTGIVDGNETMRDLHGLNGLITNIIALAQVIVVILLWWRVRSLWWPILASVVLFALVATQVVTGEDRDLAWHVTFGSVIVAADTALLFWAFTLRAVGRERA
ncbi:hypothetical protein ACTWP5_09575 [Streptomyces sp. 4N509B]|uniref:hypothetical protein n=1 Tax=Streptomyces sp. 4N509B TaxID=3457413 RepID=UPI003FD1FA25